ncbi:MAG: hypothetical protein OSJ55_06860 [Bacteroidales bacterium]|nr:hypothetical protein [Bacteroidales bacterium]
MSTPLETPFRYAYILAMESFPDCDVEEDGSLSYCEAKEFYPFMMHYDEVEKGLPFTREKFYSDEDICVTVMEYGLDLEMFWYAVAFIYYVTKQRCQNTPVIAPNLADQLYDIYTYLGDAKEFSLKVSGKGKLTVKGSIACGVLRGLILKTLKENGKNMDYSEVLMNELETKSMSLWIWYAYNLFKELFIVLKLPTRRTRNVKGKYQYRQGEWVLVGGTDQILFYEQGAAYLTPRSPDGTD